VPDHLAQRDRSSPDASASRCASVTAVKATKWMRLRASFIRVAGTERAGVHDLGAHPFEDRRRHGVRRLVAADHDRQRAVWRAQWARR
jgi:hypothetical protein